MTGIYDLLNLYFQPTTFTDLVDIVYTKLHLFVKKFCI